MKTNNYSQSNDVELKAYKHLLLWFKNDELFNDPANPRTILAEAGAGTYEQMAKDAVDLLSNNTDKKAVCFDFNSAYGTFKVEIKQGYTYDDAVEYVTELFNLEVKKYKEQQKIKEKIDNRVEERRSGVNP